MVAFFWMFLVPGLFVWIVWELWRSPKGYENEHGFHITDHEDAGRIRSSHQNIAEIKKLQHLEEEAAV